jgi:hypothetical protein
MIFVKQISAILILALLPKRKSDPLCFLMFTKGILAAAPNADIQNGNCFIALFWVAG